MNPGVALKRNTNSIFQYLSSVMGRVSGLFIIVILNISVSTAQTNLPRTAVDNEIAVIWETENGLYCSFNQDEPVYSDQILRFFLRDNLWTTTATNGSGIQRGDPITLTWSIVPDGLSIRGFVGEPTSLSDLIDFFDTQIGSASGPLSNRPWFPPLEQGFIAWANLSGINLVYEPNDDGAAFPGSSGVIGVRGDIRIGGHLIDGEMQSNILAYNFFPNTGDMVIDTGNSGFYGDATNDYLGLRQVISHEHGHGLGIEHSCPIDETKLMEPFISDDFDGPQEDDILAGNRGYGDVDEFPSGNDSSSNATNLGALDDNSNLSFNNRSIDGNSDQDFYSFTVPANHTASITLTPTGTTYDNVAQPANSSCPAVGTPFNALTQNNLALQLRDQDGTTVLANANSAPAGGVESITNAALSDAGTYFVRITGSTDTVQMYQLDMTIASLPDGDDDGVPDSEDNCPTISNPSQVNSDDDLLGDACDDDDDNDDIPDAYENLHGLNPLVDDAGLDQDGDGLTNLEEFDLGLEASDPDSDGDGIQDDRDPFPGSSDLLCTGPDPVLQNQLISEPFVCAGSSSVTIDGTVTQPAGDLLIISPTTRFGPDFRVENGGVMRTQATDPCPLCNNE